MKKRIGLLAVTGLAVASLALVVPERGDRSAVSHAGGFVCGALASTNNRILGGDHRTHFNIRNGNNQEVVVSFELALGFPSADPAANGASFTPGATASLQSVTLGAGEAVMIDCDEILAAATPLDTMTPPPYFSGILDARSRRPLQVTRTQTAGPNGEDVTALSVTEISATRMDTGDGDDEDDEDD